MCSVLLDEDEDILLKFLSAAAFPRLDFLGAFAIPVFAP
jgi:hypothetical protein